MLPITNGISSILRLRFSFVIGMKTTWADNMFILQDILNVREWCFGLHCWPDLSVQDRTRKNMVIHLETALFPGAK